VQKIKIKLTRKQGNIEKIIKKNTKNGTEFGEKKIKKF
jgi:hypothetical protein